MRQLSNTETGCRMQQCTTLLHCKGTADTVSCVPLRLTCNNLLVCPWHSKPRWFAGTLHNGFPNSQSVNVCCVPFTWVQ